MNSRELKAELIRAGVPQAHIARKLGIGHSVVSDVIAGRRSSRRVEETICQALRLDNWPIRKEDSSRGRH